MSDDITRIGDATKKVLADEGRKFSIRVVNNLKSKGISKSGKTAASMHEDATTESLIVWGRKDFQNLETGVSPSEAKQLNFQQLKANIYDWSKYLPLTFETTKKRYSFAWNVSNKILEFGTRLYQQGGRNDIFSNEYQLLYDSISKQIGTIIIEHKIL